MESLVERTSELAEIDAALDRAVGGEASILIIEGDPGIGKSGLLRSALSRARDRGVRALSARGSELEREHAYGVVRQLLAPDMFPPGGKHAAPPSGAARLAWPVLRPDGDGDGDTDGDDRGGGRGDRPPSDPDQSAVLHGLYWVIADLAAHQPVLIAIDDAHWSDAGSQRFAAFLGRRLDGLPIMLAASVRSEDAAMPSAPLRELADEPLTTVLRPRPLSGQAVRELITEALREPVDAEFAAACATVTGGLPFLVRELLNGLADDGVAPARESIPIVERFTPQTVARATMFRLRRVGEAATLVAQAVAVLGPRGTTWRLSELTGSPNTWYAWRPMPCSWLESCSQETRWSSSIRWFAPASTRRFRRFCVPICTAGRRRCSTRRAPTPRRSPPTCCARTRARTRATWKC